MTEASVQIVSPETQEVDINSRFGILMVGHDAIELDISEHIIASSLDRLKLISRSVELAGVVVIPPLTPTQVRQIYPDLNENYLAAFSKVFSESESIVVVFKHSNINVSKINFISEIKKIKGKIKKDKTKNDVVGWSDSIREAIPIPGNRGRFEQVDMAITASNGNLTPDIYIQLTNHLVHSPDNLNELAGVYALINPKDRRIIFGKHAKIYNLWAESALQTE